MGSTQLTISGSEFRTNGSLIAGLEDFGDSTIVPIGNRTLTGIFADGIPFAISDDVGEDDLFGDVRLIRTQLGPVGPDIVTASTDEIPSGIRAGQTLNVDRGGLVPDHFNAGPDSVVNIVAGGVVGRNFESIGANVTITGGTVGPGFDVFHDSQLTISGGSFGDGFQAHSDSIVQITGGAFGDGFETRPRSQVTFVGRDFRLDGVPVGGLEAVGDRVTASVSVTVIRICRET